MHPPAPVNRSERTHDSDAAIRQTDSDAALARLSAVRKGYMNDHFVSSLVPRAQLQPLRPPLINIGTYVRSEAIDRLVEQWLELSKQEGQLCQIVSLGAGSDTRFWRLMEGPWKEQLGAYFELDFPDVTLKKAMAIRNPRSGLSTTIGPSELDLGGQALHSSRYHLLPCDLRKPPADVLPGLFKDHLSPGLPTLLLFECVLVYMSPEASSTLIQWFVDFFSPSAQTPLTGTLGATVYEMFGLEDAFGQVMMNNLRARNVSLPGAKPYSSLESLPARFLRHGFTSAKALTLRNIRSNYTELSELERISSLEMLDEVEELNLVLEHYAITWGVMASSAATIPWSEWGLRPVK
ncbi:S-adenosyl-L-methionine-dependent methyltransferase [Suillus paluster]|uniref:S-adenosyl-L-methionine-dependent methyltransferase n=1 Tax=Suillus paluster TaxID=48578 RepID=UPI001B88138A|nr:S-adenosyl-L-methionine-dependent methyltransferase [Suillus paluster]KAG1737885.1 S-adenosyl-L-methionine-dependent methyltransferase [Suillus paluster]